MISIEKSGKTIHLLKQNSKQITSNKKRKKVDTHGTYTEYMQKKKVHLKSISCF